MWLSCPLCRWENGGSERSRDLAKRQASLVPPVSCHQGQERALGSEPAVCRSSSDRDLSAGRDQRATWQWKQRVRRQERQQPAEGDKEQGWGQQRRVQSRGQRPMGPRWERHSNLTPGHPQARPAALGSDHGSSVAVESLLEPNSSPGQ